MGSEVWPPHSLLKPLPPQPRLHWCWARLVSVWWEDHLTVQTGKQQSWCQGSSILGKEVRKELGAGSRAGSGAFQQCIKTLSSHYQQNIFLRQGNTVLLWWSESLRHRGKTRLLSVTEYCLPSQNASKIAQFSSIPCLASLYSPINTITNLWTLVFLPSGNSDSTMQNKCFICYQLKSHIHEKKVMFPYSSRK